MKRACYLSLAIVFWAVAAAAQAPDDRPSKLIDPFLGVAGGGNTFPGPTLPFGMIKPGPDMATGGNDGNAGWTPQGPIEGFSQTHVSGTGGGAKYGNILVQPTVGKSLPPDHSSAREEEKASAGLYQVSLARYHIDVAISTARRTAIYKFTYPSTDKANLIFDVAHCLKSSAGSGESQAITASDVTVVSPTEVSGSSSVTNGWNKQPNSYTVYFYAFTDTPARSWGTWRGTSMQPGSKHSSAGPKTENGSWLSFKANTHKAVMMKIGISFISIGQAKRNARDEISGFNFNKTQQAAVDAWNKALSIVTLQGETTEQAQVFYTALYHTMLMPVDRSGENPLWQSTEPYYDDYYAIWDTFRSSNPLLTLIAPQRETDIVRALVDLYRHEKWLPDARSGNYNGRTQGGSNAEFVITDAYLKGLKGIDWNTAYDAEKNDAEVAPKDQIKEGRGGLDDWHKLGFVTIEGVDRPGSKQMEYAANDFEIAILAKALGKTEDYRKYLKRSGNWEALWDDNFEDSGFRGFIRPKHRDGSWLKPFLATEDCSWGGNTFYEANSWTYSTFVPQNIARLMERSGGQQTFVNRLDAFFTGKSRYDVGNEPGFLSPYLYIWAKRHDKTAEHLRQIIATSFHAGRNGIPGNDDSGAMSSWYAFGQIGIFPNAGQDVYLIGSPQIPQTTIHLASGKDFIIEAKGVSANNIYVTAAKLNGMPLDRAWFRHAEISDGGRLELTMAAAPNSWPTGDLPPSYASTP